MWRRLADWCVPAGAVFPQHLTRGDPPPAFIFIPRYLSTTEVERLKQRWSERHASHHRPTTINDHQGWWM